MSPFSRVANLLAVTAVTLTLQASCARSLSDEQSDPLLFSPNATTPVPLTACVSTECPAPWATCPNGGLCTTDTSRDIDHCGSCGNTCPKLPAGQHATSICAGSKCLIACDELSADCNRNPADGCEVYTGDDPNNCGGCGLACKVGDVCWKGACGCPTGFTQCGTECVNLQTDDLSCGACDKKCVAPPLEDPEWKCGPGIEPPHTEWSCGEGACKLSCKGAYGDCDHDLCKNGCEIDRRTDPLNCGACGNACAPNQECDNGTCVCPPGTVRCGKRCTDVNVDPNNCGACGNGCEGAGDPTANGTPTCKGGTCGYLCYAGFADCDGRINNGCEVNIGTDPLHCGGCGTKCDAARSQPCVLGQCLTKPCEPGRGTL